jgi:PPOX class probable F420-dependent enzyme
MPINITPELETRLREEKTIWLTTISADGQPQPSPVWFLWENGTFLIYSKPDAPKIDNIARNPKVALHLRHTDSFGEDGIAIFYGEAKLEPGAPLSNQIPAYVEKYRQGVADLGWTSEKLANDFSAAIRITPTRLRA